MINRFSGPDAIRRYRKERNGYIVKQIETVKIVDSRYGYFPRRFVWRKGLFEVLRVERVESTRREWPRRRQNRTFWVHTAYGLFVLSHDLLHDLWSVQKTPSGISRAQTAASSEGAPRAGRLTHGHRLALVR
jgi:hypothetical protein